MQLQLPSPLLLIFMASLLLSLPLQAAGYTDNSSPFYRINGEARPALLAKKWDDLSAQEKARIKKAKDRYKKMSKQQKDKLRTKWEKMSPEERKKYTLEKKYRR